jgi:anthranilate synthase/aminodeoxychorismate synthase-like glutamine amidotransferase
MLLLIDNFDSFTYNVVQCIGTIDPDLVVEVRRNDAVTIDEIDAMKPSHLVVSPGPCTPAESGVSMAAIKHLAGAIPILGICLGHQCLAEVFGGRVVRAERLMHGKTSQVQHDGKTIYAGVPNPFTATRYHSLTVEPESVPDTFEVSSRTQDRGEIMGIRHRSLPIEGVQFHPESFLTEHGPLLIANFLKM